MRYKLYNSKVKRVLAGVLSGVCLFTGVVTFSGCSKQKVKEEIGISISDEPMFSDEIDGFETTDGFFNFTNKKGLNDIDYKYLIDYRYMDSATNIYGNETATFAKEIETAHFTSDFFSNGTTMTKGTFRSGYQNIVLPDDYSQYGSIDHLVLISGNKSEFICKKLKTIDNEILYLLDSKIVMGKYMASYNTKSDLLDGGKLVNGKYCVFKTAKPDEFFKAETLFREKNGKIEVLAHHQTGIGSDNDNVKNLEKGDITKSVMNVENSPVFSVLVNGSYDEAYLREALDTYSDTDNYYSSTNKGKNFSKFKNN